MDSPIINGVKKLDENYIYGRWGAYQVFQSAIAFYNILPTGFQLLIGVFIGYRPTYQCSSSSAYENQTYTNNSYFVTYNKCHIKVFYNDTTRDAPELVKDDLCTEGYQYSLDKYSTFVTEMDLVCDQAYLGELVQTLIMAGQLVGAAIASSLSDKWGRKTVHLTSHLLTLAFGIGVAFSPNYITLAILKFIIGVLQQGMVMSDAVLTLELFPEKTRFYAEAIGLFCWTTSLVIMAPIGYLMRDYSWRYLQIVLTGFSLFSLIQYWVQDESLRWLVANGKKEAADKVIHKVARWNKINYDDLKMIVDKRMASTEQNTQKADKNGTTTENTPQEKLAVEKYSIVTILKHRRILITSLIMWFTCLGRRTITIVFHAVCGISLASATLLNHFSGTDSSAKMASIITTFAGKSAITGSFSTLFLYTPELYPTNLRNAGIGFSSAFSRLGAIISPFAGTLAEEIPWAPGTIFSAMCLTVTLIILYVPETRGVELPQTLVEVKVWYTEKSGLRQQQKVESTKL
ncbi:solute carrier family 22 member 6-A isoform X2 [Magallana gigas]|uniref:solute carrier family 22 member 6-A isoform X2 n=1 Tax=Magallana gigas TaxID=29159 RepID=UPI00333FF4FC